MSSSKARSQGWVPLLVVCALLAAAPLAAGESGWYLAGKVGQARVEGSFGPRVLGWRVHDEDTAASLEVGYAFNRYLGLQAGYHDLGTYPGQARPCTLCNSEPLPLISPIPTDAHFTGYSLSAVPRWPVTERVSVYGKLGVLDWDSDLTLSQAQTIAAPSDRELLTGIGAEYAFPRGLGLLVEYERSDLMSTASLGASWHF